MANSNPLIPLVLRVLREHPAGLGIHQLLERLEQQGLEWPPLPGEGALALYGKNFFLMNALFELQASLLADGVHLRVSTLEIRLELRREAGGALPGPAQGELREFYADWRNLQVSQAQVEALLESFWRALSGGDRRGEALQLLGVPPEAQPGEIRRAYRRLAALHHPDRGGDPERFVAIRAAWELLSGGA